MRQLLFSINSLWPYTPEEYLAAVAYDVTMITMVLFMIHHLPPGSSIFILMIHTSHSTHMRHCSTIGHFCINAARCAILRQTHWSAIF